MHTRTSIHSYALPVRFEDNFVRREEGGICTGIYLNSRWPYLILLPNPWSSSKTSSASQERIRSLTHLRRVRPMIKVKLGCCRRGISIIPVNNKPLVWIFQSAYDIQPTNVSAEKWRCMMRNSYEFHPHKKRSSAAEDDKPSADELDAQPCRVWCRLWQRCAPRSPLCHTPCRGVRMSNLEKPWKKNMKQLSNTVNSASENWTRSARVWKSPDRLSRRRRLSIRSFRSRKSVYAMTCITGEVWPGRGGPIATRVKSGPIA